MPSRRSSRRASEPATALRGDIRFEQVGFRYGEKEQVLRDFSLHIRPGESVALVGHTGAGKSSIAKLVTRFYEFQDGRILIDGPTFAPSTCAATGGGWASSARALSLCGHGGRQHPLRGAGN
jgi:ABC-type bacteriocin/lantibiotic exporter with double-glycine peptidase domain